MSGHDWRFPDRPHRTAPQPGVSGRGSSDGFNRPLSSHPSHTPLTSTYSREAGYGDAAVRHASVHPEISGKSHGPRTGNPRGHGRQGDSGYADRPPGSRPSRPLNRVSTPDLIL